MRYTLTLLLCIALAACSDDKPDNRFEQYQSRLGRALAVEVTEPVRTPLPRPPRSGQLRLPIEADKLDALDFLALSGCEVQVTIGKRNSSLGRLARSSQRLMLELEYLRLAPACVDSLRAESRTALADQLEQAWQLKQSQLPALIFNATLGSDEYRSFWRLMRGKGTYPPVNESYSVDALRAIEAQSRRWLAGDYTTDNWSFEIHLSEVAGGPGGAIMQALIRQGDWLQQANDMLQARMAKGPLCAPSSRHKAADILPNVVRRFFIEGIQPQAAVLERRRYELMPSIVTLEDTLEQVLPDSYREWMLVRDKALADAAQAPRNHVAQLQEIMAPCEGASIVPQGQSAQG